jgi:hypothetical protein
MIRKKITSVLENKRCTLLGVGPMSLNCVNAAIEIASENDALLMLIASRRQIDSEEFGGGYVNNWTTTEFADYIYDTDKKGNIILARDHGGPWQNEIEITNKLGLKKALDSAKSSFKADIDAGFQILHIDPSLDIHIAVSPQKVLERLYELYEFCWSYAQRTQKEILFEIGTEEQSGFTNTQEELDYVLNEVGKFCINNKLPKPLFVVVQTGTKVMETRNIGSLDRPLRVANEIPAEIQVPRMVEVCRKHGVLMKEHNADYLSCEALSWHPRLGIHAANIAPEFGVAETRGLVSILEQNNLHQLLDDFIRLSLDSGKWKKWMIDGTASDRDRAIIAGHYVFSRAEFKEIKAAAESQLRKKKIELDDYLKQIVKGAILRYIVNFNLRRSL